MCPGKPISYSIVVGNVGPTNATGVSIAGCGAGRDHGRDGELHGQRDGTCGTNASAGNNISFTGASVAAGAGHQLTITVNGTVSASATGALDNTATVTAGAGQSDPNNGQQQATDTNTPAQADVTITKTGPAGSDAGRDADLHPHGEQQRPRTGGRGVGERSDAGGPDVRVERGRVHDQRSRARSATSRQATTRTITSTYQLPSNYTSPNPIVNTATVTNSHRRPRHARTTRRPSRHRSPPRRAICRSSSTSSAAAVLPGQTFTYTLQMKNNGPSDATNVRVTDPLPANTTFISSVAGCTAIGQMVTCPAIPTMAVGAQQAFDIVVQLNPAYTGDGSDILNSGDGDVGHGGSGPAEQHEPRGRAARRAGGRRRDAREDTLGGTCRAGPDVHVSPARLEPGPVEWQPTSSSPIRCRGRSTFVSSPQGCTAVDQDVTCPTIATMNPGDVHDVHAGRAARCELCGRRQRSRQPATVQATTPDPVPGNNTTPPVRAGSGRCERRSVDDEDHGRHVGLARADVHVSHQRDERGAFRRPIGHRVRHAAEPRLQFVSSPQACTAAAQDVTCTQRVAGAGRDGDVRAARPARSGIRGEWERSRPTSPRRPRPTPDPNADEQHDRTGPAAGDCPRQRRPRASCKTGPGGTPCRAVARLPTRSSSRIRARMPRATS